MTQTLDQQIGTLIRQYRRDRDLTQSDIGKGLGITFQQVQKYEAGTNRISLTTFLRLCKFLKIEPAAVINKLEY